MIGQWERAFKALGQETRLKLFLTLAHQRFCVCQLENAFNSSQPAISQHLRILREAGLVRAERQGLWTFYQADVEALNNMLQAFNGALTDTVPSEIQRISSDASQVELEGCSVDNT